MSTGTLVITHIDYRIRTQADVDMTDQFAREHGLVYTITTKRTLLRTARTARLIAKADDPVQTNALLRLAKVMRLV